MKKFTSPLFSIALMSLVLVADAYAVQTSHRPWFSKEGKSNVSKVEPSRPRKSVVRVKKSAPPRATRKGHQIAQQAAKYKGVKYRFGGDSKSKGFDCSGLVRRIYNDLNLKRLPRTSSGLYAMGTAVRLNDLRPGDLVFFKNTYKKGISHVGVYAGNNRFIHAENRHRGVRMTPLSDPYYQLHYAGARRLY